MPAGVIFTAKSGSWFVYVVKSGRLIEYHSDRRKGSVFWNMFCSLMAVKYCSVFGINDFAGIFSAGPGSPVVSLHSSIWYYLALIELSSIPSLSPPSALLLSSFPLLPARDGSSERRHEPSPLLFFFAQAQTAAPRQSTGSSIFLYECFLTYHLRSQSLLFTFPVFFHLFSLPPPLPVCCSPRVSHSLPQSIINFNLRAGLNGTIRERSMLSIWMPARFDLGIPHQRRRRGKNSSLFVIATSHSHKPAHPNHRSDTWMQEVEDVCSLSRWEKETGYWVKIWLFLKVWI